MGIRARLCYQYTLGLRAHGKTLVFIVLHVELYLGLSGLTSLQIISYSQNIENYSKKPF